MEKVRALLGHPPARYLVFALVSGLIIYLGYVQTDWRPFASINNEEATAFSRGMMQLVFPAVAAAPLLALRYPLSAGVIAASPLALSVLSENQWPFVVFLALLASAMTATWRSVRRAGLLALGALALVATLAFGWSTMLVPYGATIDSSFGRTPDFGLLAMYAVVIGLAGALALWQRADVLGAVERADLARDRRELVAESAVVAERARLARDLHDVVAHHVSLIAVRAETSPYTHPDLDPAARTLLADIATDARLALDELRGVLGILGRSDGASDRAPQPSWSDIDALVERARGTGTDIRLTGSTSTGAEVGPTVGYVAYRVVQEALTNARKHAPGRPVTLELGATPGLVVVQASTPSDGAATSTGNGHGLAGMRERVEALGGMLTVDRRADEFVVRAALPQAVG